MYLPTDRCLMGSLVEGCWLKKRCMLLFILIFAFTSIVFGSIPQYSIANTGDDSQKDVLQKALNLHVPFIANQGQIADKTIQFYAQTLGGGVYIRQDGEIAYTFSHAKLSARSFFKENLINASQVTLKGKIPSSTKVSYYLGNDKQKWHTRINSYDEINFGDVYGGIELKLRAYGKNVEKIFTVRPGSDPGRIRLNIPAADSLIIKEDGKLEIINGKEKVRFSKPIAYQEINGKRIEIQVAYFVKNTIYGFNVGEYNKSHPLIIDPSLTDVSYIGGENEDVSYGIVMDQINGDIYIAGSTNSWPLYYGPDPVPATEIIDSYYSGVDAFVMKISDNGNALTYLGGESDDFCYGIALGEQGPTKYVYLTGQTYSKKFPSKDGFDSKIGGGVDAWVARLSTELSLNCSTYIGGGGEDAGYAIAVDDDGSAYVTGETLSSNFPIPVPGVAFASSKGKTDAFVAKFEFTSSACDLIYSTYLGGNGEDRGFDIIVGPDNLIYVTGQTSSPDFFISGSSLSSTLKGTTDAYLTVFNANLGAPVNYSSYIGGYGDESGEGIVIDDLIYLTGWTSSSESWLPCDDSVSECTPNGAKDAFLIGLEQALSGDAFSYFTYIGGENDDLAYDMVVGNNGNILLTGETISGSGDADFFVAELQLGTDGYSIETFGGASEDVGFGLSVDISGDIYVTGSTYGFPGEELDDKDAFVAVLCEDFDDDGVCDSKDNCPEHPNPDQADFDEDAWIDGILCTDENCGGDVCDNDDDNDRLLDEFEDDYASLDSKNDDTDGDGILDGDDDNDDEGLDNYSEQEIGTDPEKPDTDGDIWSDNMEYQAETGPLDPSDFPDGDIFASGVYVVDPINGKDTNLGTEKYPLKSIHAAADRVNWLEDAGDNYYLIRIADGTYNISGDEMGSPITIYQNVHIEPLNDGGEIILDGEVPPGGSSDWTTGLIFSKTSNVALKDLTLKNFDIGVLFLTDGGCATLENVTIEACKEGIKLVETFQLNLSLPGTTKIMGCETGISIETESSDNSFIGGTLTNNGVGIDVRGGIGNSFIGGTIDGGGYGLLLKTGAESFTVQESIIQNLDVGLGFQADGAHVTLLGTNIQGCRTGVEFLENYLIRLDLLPFEQVDTTISGCNTGIFFRAGSSNNTVYKGLIEQNNYGIVFEACPGDIDGEAPDDNQIIETKLLDNIYHGIAIFDGSGNQLFDLDVSGSETGVYIDKNGSDNVIRGGSIYGNIDQNFVIDGRQNLIENITIEASGETGIGNVSGDTTLYNLTIDGNSTVGYGMIVDGTGKVVLQDVDILNFKTGIGFLTDAACIQLNNSSIKFCDIGIDIRENYMLNIDLGNSSISNCGTGIEVAAGSSNNIVRNGTIGSSIQDGILVDACSETPDENRFVDIVLQSNGRHGVAFMAGFNNQVEGCTIKYNNLGASSDGFGGVAILNGSADVLRSRIFGNGCNGVFVDEATDVNISGNLIFKNPEGIHLSFTNDVAIASNTITGNEGPGLYIGAGSLPDVSYNILYANSTLTQPPEPAYDIKLEGAYDAGKLRENNIGVVDQIDLPPTNISIDPHFNDAAGDDYTLKPTSSCIDGTSGTEPGIDLNGRTRPRGFSWDLGAYETSSFKDEDNDGMPDPWEQVIADLNPDYNDFWDVLPHKDDDGDGFSNLDEFLQGSDPTVPVYVAITDPADNLHFTDDISASLEIFTVNVSSVNISTGEEATPNGDGTWSADVALDLGYNIILVTASGTVDGLEYVATDTLTIIRDSAAPTLSIINPTTEGTYTTTLASISISGLANDDTKVGLVAWDRNAACIDPDNPGGDPIIETSSGDAVGTDNWYTGSIALCSGVNEITITVFDIFNIDKPDPVKTSELIFITQTTQESGVNNVAGDLSSEGNEPVFDDPLDIDLDGYTNDDEIACGSDPLCSTAPCESDLPAIPANYDDSLYPTGHEKHGYLWPDCLNPDIDNDGLPNWWEEQYFAGSPTDADPLAHDDDDVFNNQQEYDNGTDPYVPQTIGFELTLIDPATDTPIDVNTWLPAFGSTVKIEAVWIGDQLEPSVPAPGSAVFSLLRTSSHPGRAMNDPNPANMTLHHYPLWYFNAADHTDNYHGPDFGLATAPLNSLNCLSDSCFSQGNISVTDSGGGTYVIYLNSFDYAASANVVVTDDLDGNYIGQKWVPEGSNKNGIGNAWQYEDDLNPLDPNADADTIVFVNPGSYNAPQGDDFSNFEEYRGIVFTETVGSDLEHIRLNPYRKDLFIRAIGFHDPSNPNSPDQAYNFTYGDAFFNAGIDVHNTTTWGHDATEDGSFYVYYHEGAITEISAGVVTGSATGWSDAWPKHEWEFKLDAHPEENWTPISYWRNTGDTLGLDFDYESVATGSYSYQIRKPVPHINILIIKHDREGLFGGVDGHIKFVSASSPTPQNPFGTRYWRWSTKGYAWCQTTANQASMYGLSVTLERPLFHYFNDRPYFDSNTWNGAAWNSSDGKLNPLSMVEDQSDQLDPIDGILGDSPNGNWDGDRRLSVFLGHLSPFDIDNNGSVELPLASDPFDIGKEYGLNHVLKHTITHEMAHALAGPSHTSDPDCLMYKYSNNWDRADYLSDYYRSILRIHNIVR